MVPNVVSALEHMPRTQIPVTMLVTRDGHHPLLRGCFFKLTEVIATDANFADCFVTADASSYCRLEIC